VSTYSSLPGTAIYNILVLVDLNLDLELQLYKYLYKARSAAVCYIVVY
jgi:hypothetical protein